METTDVSLVILVRNRAGLLPMSLSHLELQTHPAARFEILIVDLASTDDTREVLGRYAAGAPVRTCQLYTDTTCPAKARNLAVHEACGRWLLFLDGDLLAGPRLVETHVAVQEHHDGRCAVVGAIEHHPQISAGTFTKRYYTDDGERFLEGQPLRFIDWRIWNLSLPRADVLESGGFDEMFTDGGYEDLELSWRLENKGIRGFFSDESVAYIWRPTTLDAERRRFYAEGSSLRMLIEKTQAEVVRNRLLHPLQSRFIQSERSLVPFYRRICGALASNTRCFSFMCRRVLVHSFLEGYRNAMQGRGPHIQPE